MSTRIPALDGLRGLAILLVLLWHLVLCQMQAQAGTLTGYFYKLFHHSYSGVDLFFVLSGFLITGILLKEIGTSRWLGVFWIRRSFRILPLYGLFLAVCFLIYFARGQPSASIPNPAWPYFIMLQNFWMGWQNQFGPWGITWSLAIEEQFYLVFPLILSLGFARKCLPLLCFALVVLSLILRIHGEYLYSFVLTPYRLDGFAVGVFLAWLLRKADTIGSLQRIVWITPCLLALSLTAFAAITLRSASREPYDHTIFALGYGVLLLHLVVHRKGVLAILFSSKGLCWLGVISYPLYLFHEMCLWGCHQLFGTPSSFGEILAIAGCGLIFSLVVAFFLNSFFGNPLLSFGRSISENIRHRKPNCVAP
jgi:peptidoglycan/LPS O-acetylase OafA/YrhL